MKPLIDASLVPGIYQMYCTYSLPGVHNVPIVVGLGHNNGPWVFSVPRIYMRVLENPYSGQRGVENDPPWKILFYTVNYTYIESTYPRGHVSSCHIYVLAAVQSSA
jgi:hypothetical protein